MKLLEFEPHEFMAWLSRRNALWRRAAGGRDRRLASRFAKKQRRKHIRAYKKLKGVQSLATFAAALANGPAWQTTRADDIAIVVSQRRLVQGVAPDDIQHSNWREMKRLLHEGLPQAADLGLVKTANAGRANLPNLATKQLRGRKALRGLFLESLGIALLPHLDGAQERRLVEAGALVVRNERVALDVPEVRPQAAQATRDLWHRTALDCDLVHKRGLMGAGVRIGILDSGVDPDHVEFEGKSIHFRAFAGSGAVLESVKAKDYHWHGTHVAGICSGRNVGIAPAADLSVAAVLTYKGEDGGVFGYLAQILHGLNWLVQDAGTGDGVDIVNMSLGMRSLAGSELLSLYDLCDLCREVGTLLVAAIGNSGEQGQGNHGYPARFDNVLSVGAVGRDGIIASFSDWGSAYKRSQPLTTTKPDLCAPGVDIFSAMPGNLYEAKSGTSMAAPIVSGVAALLAQKEPHLLAEPQKVVEKLLASTKRLTESDQSHSERTGSGVISLANF